MNMAWNEGKLLPESKVFAHDKSHFHIFHSRAPDSKKVVNTLLAGLL
jgi:hypothetical protein